MMVSPHQMIAGGFASRVRAIRLITMSFIKGWRALGQGTINLVGRNMKKAEILLCIFIQIIPVDRAGFQKPKGTDDIGLDKVFRSMNRPVDMTFSGKIDNGAGSVARSKSATRRIADIAMYEDVPLICIQAWRDSRDYPHK